MSDEQERAQRSVERAFPAVARFLSGEPAGPTEWRDAGAGLGELPVFGPTDPFGDGETTPDVIVRVDFLLSREQLVTALGISWAEIAGDRSIESLTVVEARYEVEGYLAVQALDALDGQMERDRQRVFPPESQRAMHALAEVVDRAYPAQVSGFQTPAMQTPRYGDGTVTLQTLDHGEIVVDEPAWCTGHDDELVVHRADITHNGRHVTASAETEHGTVDILDAHLSHAPYGQLQPEPRPVVAVSIGIEDAFTVEDGRQVAQGLNVAGLRLARLVADAGRLQRGER